MKYKSDLGYLFSMDKNFIVDLRCLWPRSSEKFQVELPVHEAFLQRFGVLNEK